jgi:hypothetical protein
MGKPHRPPDAVIVRPSGAVAQVQIDAIAHRADQRPAAASILCLRWGIRPPRDLAQGDWSFSRMRRLYTHRFSKYCGGGTICLPSTEYRRERYATLRALADAHGVRLHQCHCKNPDLIPDLAADCGGRGQA